MKIEDIQIGGPKKPQTKKTEKAPTLETSKGGEQTTKSGDQVEISGNRSQMEEIHLHYNNLTDIRSERLMELKSKIESGNYRPKAEEVAQAIIRYVQQY